MQPTEQCADAHAEVASARVVRQEFESYKNHTNALLSLIAILLGLVGVLFPIITYVTSVLPGNRLIDEAKRTIASLDERFAELTAREQRRMVDTAIARLNSDDQITRQSAATYLVLNAHQGLTEKQSVDIAQVAQRADISLRFQLFSVLAGSKSEYVTTLFSRALEDQDVHQLLSLILKHAAATGSRDLFDKLREWPFSRPQARAMLGSFASQAAMAAPGLLKELVNDDQFLERLDVMERAAVLTSLRGLAQGYRLSFLEDSRLAQGLRGQVVAFVRSEANKKMVVDNPGEADRLMVYDDGKLAEAWPKSSAVFQEHALKGKA